MTSYEFEVAAKNALLKVLEDDYDVLLSIKDLSLVWFGYIVGNMKCLIYSPEMGRLYAEVTWVKEHQAMYVDVYKKHTHSGFGADSLDFVAKA